MNESSGRWLSPEEQIEYVEMALRYLAELPRHAHQAQALRDTETQLMQMQAKHARGELEPIWTDADGPF